MNFLLVARHFSCADWGAESVTVEVQVFYIFLPVTS